MPTHFVCIGGCSQTGDTRIRCSTRSCWRYRNPLSECHCEDGKHVEFYKQYNPQVLEKTSEKPSNEL